MLHRRSEDLVIEFLGDALALGALPGQLVNKGQYLFPDFEKYATSSFATQ
jgi:hypothetical protein